MEQHQEKERNNMNIFATSVIFICYLVVLVLTIIWLFKLLNNAKTEPISRANYIIEEPSIYYREDEFCYENFEPFVISGALNIFDLPMKNIKKFSTALISTIFITISSFIL